MRGHVDSVGGAVTLPLHDRNHDATHGRGVRHRGARHSAEQRRRHHVRESQPTLPMTYKAACKGDDLVGDSAVQHQLSGEDEEGNGEERKHVHARYHHLNGGLEGQTLDRERRQTAEPDRECHRHAQRQKEDEAQTENGQCHDGITSLPVNKAIRCSMENSVMSTPAMRIGT